MHQPIWKDLWLMKKQKHQFISSSGTELDLYATGTGVAKELFIGVHIKIILDFKIQGGHHG